MPEVHGSKLALIVVAPFRSRSTLSDHCSKDGAALQWHRAGAVVQRSEEANTHTEESHSYADNEIARFIGGSVALGAGFTSDIPRAENSAAEGPAPK